MKNKEAAQTTKTPEFVLRAARAHRRVARKVKAASRADGLPVIGWKNGKVVKEVI